MDRKTDFAQWRQLCRAFDIELEMLERNAEVPEQEFLIIVDEQGSVDLNTFEHPKKCSYLFGRTHMNSMLKIKHDCSVRIATPHDICLFGISAASIVLADRWKKHGRIR